MNYGVVDIVRSLFVRGRGTRHRDKLKRLIGEHLGLANVHLTASARGALYLLLRSCDRHKVLVPAYTCNAVIEAAKLAGKSVAFIEVEAGGFNMDMGLLADAIDAETIVIATHQFGIPCDIRRCVEICRAAGAVVIEDSAASLGTKVDGAVAGAFGDAAVFSFDSTKLVNVPLKGGCAVVRDEEWFRRLQRTADVETQPMPPGRKLRLLVAGLLYLAIQPAWIYPFFHWWQFRRRGIVTAETGELHIEKGAFFREEFAEWQAMIAVSQFERLDALVGKRRRLYALYRSRLAGCRAFELPPADVRGEWACIRFPIRVRGDKIAYYNRAIDRGVDFAFSFTFITAPRDYREAHALADAVLDLPFYDGLRDDELDRVCRVLGSLEAVPAGGGAR